MCADEPDFEKYPKTPAEFTGVMAKQISGCLLHTAMSFFDRLRQISVPHRVESPVRGWEGRIWEVGDGEVDGSVAPGGLYAEGELFGHPPFVVPETEHFPRSIQLRPGPDDVVVGLDLDGVGDVTDRGRQPR
jgi:hypothetical protein